MLEPDILNSTDNVNAVERLSRLQACASFSVPSCSLRRNDMIFCDLKMASLLHFDASVGNSFFPRISVVHKTDELEKRQEKLHPA